MLQEPLVDFRTRELIEPFAAPESYASGKALMILQDCLDWLERAAERSDLEREFVDITGRFGIDASLGGGSRRHRGEADPDFDHDPAANRKYYDDELREIVRQNYEREIERFGYEF